MEINYKKIMEEAGKSGGILDAALELQRAEGFISERAVEALAETYGKSKAEIFDTLSFYSMIRFETKGKIRIEICRGAPCHVAGSEAVITAIESFIGCKIGETSADGRYTFTFTECQGQCQAAPTILINDKLYTNVTPESVTLLLEKGEV